MKKIWYLLLVLPLLVLSACTLHIPPYDIGVRQTAPDEWRVVLLVEPDDAEVLLNGKFIGEAYEFSSAKSALRLSSNYHELVVKRDGYKEEVVDLRDYSTQDITLRLNLRKKQVYSGYRKETRKEDPEGKTVKPEYTAKKAEEKTPPPQPETTEFEEKVVSVKVTLEISPKEASIYLDGKFWGIAPESGKIENLRFKRGTYTLEVVKPGYKTAKEVIKVKDTDLKLSIRLLKE